MIHDLFVSLCVNVFDSVIDAFDIGLHALRNVLDPDLLQLLPLCVFENGEVIAQLVLYVFGDVVLDLLKSFFGLLNQVHLLLDCGLLRLNEFDCRMQRCLGFLGDSGEGRA